MKQFKIVALLTLSLAFSTGLFGIAANNPAPATAQVSPYPSAPPPNTLPLPADNSVILDFGAEAIEQQLPGTANTDPAAPGGGFALLIGSIMSFVMVIAAVLAFLYMLWGALDWITAGGESGKIEKARQKITQSIVGMVVLSATTAIFMMLQQFLGICVLPFGSCTGGGGGGGGGGVGGGGGGGGGACGGNYAKCNGVDLPVCPSDICNNPNATQCLGTQPGNAGIVRCKYLNTPANTCGYYYWAWETSCNNQGCSGGVCQ